MVQISATAQLKQYIDRYLDERNGRSRQTLAKKTGVSYSTLSRIASLECETTFEHAITILKEVANEEETSSFVKQYYPHAYIFSMPEKAEIQPNLATHLLHDRINYEIYSYAIHNEGVSESFIKEEYGQVGLTACNNLLENKLIRFDSTSATFRANELALSTELFKNHLKTGLENITEVAGVTDQYSIAWFSERLNPVACKEIFSLLIEVHKKITNIMTTPSNFGDIPYEYGAFCKPLRVKGGLK